MSASNAPAALRIQVDAKTYPNGVQALQAVDLDLALGEFVALVGPSGAGKTTLLNLVAGLDSNSKCHIEWQDAQLSSRPPRIGMMFQEPRLLPWLSVQDNLAIVLRGLPQDARQKAEACIPPMLAQVGLADFAAAYPRQLSGGMQRRVALLRAFIVQPDWLLMDEPFQSLDAPTIAQLHTILLDLWQSTRPCVLFVTHQLREALYLADRVVFLSPRPAQVILDYPVPLPRNQRINMEMQNPALNELHDDLMRQHPQLLAGLANNRRTA